MSKNDVKLKRKDILRRRGLIVQIIRDFFHREGYLEVETPNRIPAPAPEFNIEAEPSGAWFLHTSPELCMKRLLAEGWDRIFQICKCYRRGERGRLHLPEFTLLEWYRTGIDYLDLMIECEKLIGFLATRLEYGPVLSYGSQTVDLTPPWERLTLQEAFDRYAPISLDVALERDTFEEVLVDWVEPHLGVNKPTFLYDYPVSHGALARVKRGNEKVVERFELYMAGIELANAFSELTDPEEQRKRFQAEEKKRRQFGKIPYPMPEKFLHSLGHISSAAGCALGIDRLVMLFTGAPEIGLCVTFAPEEL
ncbi:MAG: EF-P lysine aminoacylase EpmA [Syntrophales bacterium]|nr:EF-P lysine aminoacylase EpmA [Syntrophales bacterium]